MQRLVGASLWPVEIVGGPDACAAATDAEAIVVVDAGIACVHPTLRAQPARAFVVVPGDGNAPADATVTSTLLAQGWDHVIAHPMPMLAEELLATVQKIIRRDVFGLEKYMAWGAEIRSYVLTDARDREAAVATLSRDVIASGLPDRIGSLVSVITDELVANALYSAPIDEAGDRIHAHDARDKRRALAGREVVTVRWATDGRYLGIEVTDLFGSIELGTIGARVARTGTQAAPGPETGMGLALVYACANQFVVNCRPTERTEVITLLDVRYKPTELGRTASFHEFRG